LQLNKILLQGLSHETRTDTAGTNLYRHDAAVLFNRLDFLEIRIPYRTGFIVRMADVVSEAGAFSANFTFS